MKDLRRFLLALLCLAPLCAVLIAAFYTAEDWRGAREWNAAKNEVRLRGGTTDYAAIIPPPIPDDQNLAMAPLFAKALHYHIDPATHQWAFGKLSDNPSGDHLLGGKVYWTPQPDKQHLITDPDWEKGRALDLAAWQRFFRADPAFPRRPDAQSPAADVLLALTRYSTSLAELAQAAATRPKSRFPVDWNNPNIFSINLPHCQFLLKLASLLRLRACAELAEGDAATAAVDVALVFRLSDALQEDPILIDHLVKVIILDQLAQPIWEGLAARRWDAVELVKLQALLLHEDVLTNYFHSMRTEQACAVCGLDYMAQHMSARDIFKLFGGVNSEPLSLSYGPLYGFIAGAPRGWYDQNKARIVRYQQDYVLGAVDLADHRVFPAKNSAGQAAHAGESVGAYNFFFLMEIGVFDGILPKSARIQTVCDQEAIACALERYFIDHQTYPDNLSALVPSYLAKVPNDVIDGAPMRYRRTPDSRYLLYSIGWNCRDDGGTLAWKEGRPDYGAGDWVWQYQTIEPPSKVR